MGGGGGGRLVGGVGPAALMAGYPLNSGLTLLCRHEIADKRGEEVLNAVEPG